MLGDRRRHRLTHKFAYLLDRYGIDVCVGCGWCVDAEAADVDVRVVLKKLDDELPDRDSGSPAVEQAIETLVDTFRERFALSDRHE